MKPHGGLLPNVAPQRAADFVLLGSFFGLVTGVAELISRLFGGWVSDRPFRNHLGLNILWTVPVADVIVCGLLGLLVALAMTLRGGDKLTRGALCGFAAIATDALIPYSLRLHWIALVLLSVGVGVQIGGFLSRHSHGFWRFVRLATLPASCLVIVTALTIRATEVMAERRVRADLGPPPINAPNILVIVLDAVRAEDLSIYGYARSTTPNLDRLGERSVVFDRAISAAPWTLTSHGSIFTGHYPHELSADWDVPLDSSYPTLAERLRDRGYLTGAFFGNDYFGVPEYGLGRGFAHHESRKLNFSGVMRTSRFVSYLVDRFNVLTHSYIRLGRRNAAEINQLVLKWLPERESRPFFVFVNYFDAHDPYLPPAPFALKFSVTEPPTREIRSGERHTEVETRGMRDAYDGAIAYEDAQLGVLLGELQRRGHLANTVVLVTADHGEEFGEHGWLGHGNGLHLPALHVPLLISFPGQVPGGVRVAEPVTLRDLPATVIDLLRSAGAAAMPGRSLAFYWDSTSKAYGLAASPLLSEVNRPSSPPAWYAVAKGDMRSIIVGTQHYIRNGNGREELYDIVMDPWETADLSRTEAGKASLNGLRETLRSALSLGVRSAASDASR